MWKHVDVSLYGGGATFWTDDTHLVIFYEGRGYWQIRRIDSRARPGRPLPLTWEFL